MSKLAAKLFSGLEQQPSNSTEWTLGTGSTTFSIPVGVTLVTLTGYGGAGGDNGWYDPGQPYIAPSGYNAGQPAIAATPGQPYIAAYYDNPGQPYIQPQGYNAGQTYVAPTAGQPYIAPSGYHPAVAGYWTIPASPEYWSGQTFSLDSYVLGAAGGLSSLGLPDFLSYANTPSPNRYSAAPLTITRNEQFLSSSPSDPNNNPYYYITTTYTASGISIYHPAVVASGWVEPVPEYYDNPGQPYIAYDPGRPYVAPQPYVAGQAYIAPSGYHAEQLYIAPTPGQPYIAPYYTNPGQPYIAPSSGGGVYSGQATTATLNGVTRTWAGGSGAVPGPISTQTLTSNGLGQTLTYFRAATGSLQLAY